MSVASDRTDGVALLAMGSAIVPYAARISARHWDEWHGSGGKPGRIPQPLVWRLPRRAARAIYVSAGLLMVFGGLVLIINGSSGATPS